MIFARSRILTFRQPLHLPLLLFFFVFDWFTKNFNQHYGHRRRAKQNSLVFRESQFVYSRLKDILDNLPFFLLLFFFRRILGLYEKRCQYFRNSCEPIRGRGVRMCAFSLMMDVNFAASGGCGHGLFRLIISFFSRSSACVQTVQLKSILGSLITHVVIGYTHTRIRRY